MEFEQAFKHIIDFEGGWNNDADDTGGETKYGISKTSYPDTDISSLTLDDAKAIYRRDFWDKLHLDAFPAIIRLALFDSAINCGPGTSIKFLQEALGVTPDGVIGPTTLETLDDAATENGAKLVAEIMTHRFKKVSKLSNAPKYIDGWTDRMFKVVAYSV
jgi:lysozyme family protein